ncbi:MAG: transcriptional repressor LexA [Candidatus Kryptoniota bacterium]
MSKGLTKRQGEALEFIRKFISERSKPPTYREMGLHLGIRSTRAISDLVKALERKGFIEREVGRSRGISLPKPDINSRPYPPSIRAIPVISRIESREVIYSNIVGIVYFDSQLLPDGELFAAKVDDEAMNLRGVLKGDFVICKREKKFQQNSLVIASTSGVLIVREYWTEGRKIVLKPSNNSFQIISFLPDDRRLFVIGEVVLSFRKNP